MGKTGLTVILVITTMAMVAFAQNGSPRKPTGIVGTAKEISIQDDQGKGYIVINTITGEYSVVFCEYDYAFKGIGKVDVLGCNIYFSDVQDAYRMFGSASMCKMQAKISCEVFERPGPTPDQKGDPISELWIDSNLTDNTNQCWKSPK